MTPQPIDLHHQAPGIVGSYLLDTPGGPTLFDCGPTSTLPYLKAGLAERGLDGSRGADGPGRTLTADDAEAVGGDDDADTPVSQGTE